MYRLGFSRSRKRPAVHEHNTFMTSTLVMPPLLSASNIKKASRYAHNCDKSNASLCDATSVKSSAKSSVPLRSVSTAAIILCKRRRRQRHAACVYGADAQQSVMRTVCTGDMQEQQCSNAAPCISAQGQMHFGALFWQLLPSWYNCHPAILTLTAKHTKSTTAASVRTYFH